jgi:hypothetical protein
MNQPFDSDAIAKLGWRQGAILDAKLAESARKHAPTTVTMVDGDWLIVTSHDCDVVNFSLAKEPVVEVMRASVLAAKKVDKQQSSGRNPRTMQLAVEDGDDPVVLSLSVHDRWFIPRDVLLQEPPARNLPDKERRLIAEWLAKRYIRAAFPTAFDLRWRAKLKDWQKLLKANSEWIQGIYLRLSTLDELPDTTAYKCHLLVAVPEAKRTDIAWPKKRDELEKAIESFWNQFKPGIECAGVEPLGTDEITLADIEPYQRFDADWVSFDDDTPTTPAHADMTA